MQIPKFAIFALAAAAAFFSGTAPRARAVDIDGVQPLAFDQPQVNAMVQRVSDNSAYGFSFEGLSFYNLEAFLDTGSSGIVLSQFTAEDVLGVPTTPGVTYTDVAVGGTTDFAVSIPVNVRITTASTNPNADQIPTFQTPSSIAAVYDQVFPSVRAQVGPTLGNVPDAEFIFPLDVIGMPAMIGKTVVMDPKPLNNPSDDIFNFLPMNTYIYDHGTGPTSPGPGLGPGVPNTSHHVQLSYGDFDRFTTTTPAGSSSPTLAHNPFIGPNPLNKLDANPPVDNTPPISIHFNDHSAQGSFLLDTGAAVSFISSELAAALHVRTPANPIDENHMLESYVNESDPTGTPISTFTLPLQGLGGQANPVGFFLDDLILHTIEGSAADGNPNNLRFLHAPVFIQDISLEDPLTHQILLLDGVFGMNFMVASGLLLNDDSGPIPDFEILNATTGAFNWVTFDEPTGILGLDLVGVPEPGSVVLAATGLALFGAYAWRRRGALRRRRG